MKHSRFQSETRRKHQTLAGTEPEAPRTQPYSTFRPKSNEHSNWYSVKAASSRGNFL